MGKDGEIGWRWEKTEMEDYFMPVTKATRLGKRQREDSDDEMDEA